MEEEFEFDPIKSAANREKHGIDFIEAQELWKVWGTVSALPFPEEPRFSRTQRVEDRFWTAIFTRRLNRIRLISVRRSRQVEIKDYECKAPDQDKHHHQP